MGEAVVEEGEGEYENDEEVPEAAVVVVELEEGEEGEECKTGEEVLVVEEAEEEVVVGEEEEEQAVGQVPDLVVVAAEKWGEEDRDKDAAAIEEEQEAEDVWVLEAAWAVSAESGQAEAILGSWALQVWLEIWGLPGEAAETRS